jgi:hypothetical protein
VLGLGLTQIVGYGTLYYTIGILAPDIAAEFGIAASSVFGAFTLALVAGAAVAPLAGRLVDRRGARLAMAAGSVAAAAALALASVTDGIVALTLALCLTEMAGTLVLYDAAFAAITQMRPAAAARRAITQVTLVGGFASTVFWPLTHLLAQHLTWREVLLAYAALHVVLCLPLHLALLSGRPAAAARAATAAAPAARLLAPAQQGRAMVLVVVTFCLTGLILSALTINWVGSLAGLGIPTATAIAAGALLGPAQVGARIVEMVLGDRLSPMATAAIAGGLLLLAILSIFLPLEGFIAAALFAVLFGMASGLTSIVRGTVPLALFGPAGYAARLGTISGIRVFVTAAAPFGFALLLEQAGGTAAMLAAAAVAGLSLLTLWLIPRPVPGQ